MKACSSSFDVALFATAKATRGNQEREILANAEGGLLAGKCEAFALLSLFAPEDASAIYVYDLIVDLMLSPVIRDRFTAGVYSMVVIDNAKSAD